MRFPVLAALTLLWLMPTSGVAAPLVVVLRNNEPHVNAAALEREAGIVIKRLPGSGEFVACGTGQCAVLKSVVSDGETLLVRLSDLTEALHLKAAFDEDRRHVTLTPEPREAAAAAGPLQPGVIAPNFRLTKLDGSPVSLDEFRGRRVLLNSWASW